jgi:pyruvate dehydrogenase E1 component alpha subunit/2-oxoisovalerate dehydrogenase E1 component alpha subunit
MERLPTGAFHEGLNLAAVEKLPIVVLVADNQFAYSTPRERQFACENLVDRATGYGVTGREVDATNLLECLSVVGEAVKAARFGEGPQMVVGKLLRLCGHGEHDDASYVAPELKDSNLGRDCLEVGNSAGRLKIGVATLMKLIFGKGRLRKRCKRLLLMLKPTRVPDPYQDDWQAFSSKGINS